jgi:beta-lactam-binding protein with PASTA domain
VKRGFSPAATAAFVTTLVVLGLVGWSIGWLAAGTELASGEPTKSPTVTSAPTRTPSPTPTRTASSSPTASANPQRTDAFAMPDLVGKKFLVARQQAFDLKLGVTVKFDEPANGKPTGTVMKTTPEAKDFVWRGLTIVLHVAGAPIKLAVPVLVGKTCNEGKDTLVQAGFRVAYATQERGKVTKSDPPAFTEMVWNDEVKLHCAAS